MINPRANQIPAAWADFAKYSGLLQAGVSVVVPQIAPGSKDVMSVLKAV